MKILHLTNAFSAKAGGGVFEVVSNLVSNQKEDHLDPNIWHSGKCEMAIRNTQNIRQLKYFGKGKLVLLKDIFYKKSRELYQFDIIHQHGIWLTNSLLTIQLRKKYRIPTIIQPHGYLEPYALTMSRIKKKIVWTLFEKSNLKNADVLLACSTKEAINLRKLFPYKSIAIIPNGISKEFFSAKSSEQIKDTKTMLFLSRIHPSKGLERFLTVVADLGKNYFKDWHIIIAGSDELNHTEYLIKLASRLGIRDLISFPGPIYKQEKIDLISNADLFFLPTFTENFGIVVAEALARSVPVLTTTGAPWSDLNSRHCGFWVENDSESLKKGLINALETPESELKNMGARGRRLIEENFLWPAISRTTYELYRWLLTKEKKPDIFFY
jgi:glycosyltransferase involved in cell wall biosynthesis